MAIGVDERSARLACLDRFMDSVNAHNVVGIEREMHFNSRRVNRRGGSQNSFPILMIN
jgi:hypothetical protein